MTSEIADVKASLSTLFNSLNDLEAHLRPLFNQPLPEFAADLDRIQEAKLQTVLSYLIYDLIFSALELAHTATQVRRLMPFFFQFT